MLLSASIAQSSPLVTTITKSDNTITLEWNTPAPSFIVEQSESLMNWDDSAQVCAVSAGDMTDAVQFESEDANRMFFKSKFGVLLTQFPDPEFWQEVLEARTYSTGPVDTVYDIDFTGVVDLVISNNQVFNCSGIEQLPDVRRVAFAYTQISDLTPVAAAMNLTFLQIYDSPLSDLTPIVNMPNLETLLLQSTQVSNLLPLLSLPKLKSLSVGDCPLADFTTISQFSNLTTLGFAHDSITNADFLSGMSSLTELSLSGSYLDSLQDISGLSALTGLRKLDLRYNNISDISSLTTLTLLEDINLVGNQNISNISCVANMLGLLELKISGTQVSDLTALQQLTNLTWVYLPNNQITDLAPLITNASLGGLGEGDSVYLKGNPLSTHAQTNQIPELRNTYNVEVNWE